MTVDVSQFMVPGGVYTLTFAPSGFLSYVEHPDEAALQASLYSIPNISAATLVVRTPPGIGGTDYYDVTFQYVGDGSDVIAGPVSDILTAFTNTTSVNWNFVAATDQPTGVASQSQGTSGTINLGSLGTGISTTVALAVVGLVVLFLLVNRR